MADIQKELNDIKNAVYGREVRSSIHDGIKKINDESEESKQKAEEAHEITQDLLDETFDSAALEANFKQRLDDEIRNLQPEWTQFKDQTTQQLEQIALNLVNYRNPDETDWSLAFERAHDALPQTGGKILVPRDVVIKNPVIFTKKVHLDGLGQTSIAGDDSRATSVIIKDGNFDAITLKEAGSRVTNLQIDGVEGNEGDGIVIASSRIGLENVTVTRQGGDGIRVGTDDGDNCNLWNLQNIISLHNGGHGVNIHHGVEGKPDTNAGYLLGLDARRNGGDGLHLGNTADNTFRGVVVQNNGGVGVRISKNARGQYLYFPYAEQNGEGSFREIVIEDGARRNFVQGQRSVINYESIVNESDDSNMVIFNNFNVAGSPYYHDSPTAFKKIITKNNNISGYWSQYQDDNRNLIYELEGTTTSQPVAVEYKTNSTGGLTIKVPEIEIGGTRIKTIQTRYNTINLINIPPQSTVKRTINFEGVKAGETVIATPRGDLAVGLFVAGAYCLEDGIVTLVIGNTTTERIDGGQVSFRFTHIGFDSQ